MKTYFLKINMELVRKTIKERGFYYITAERLFDKGFVGSKLYIVTDDPEFKKTHSELADMTIISVAKFELIAEAVNEFIGNEDRERHRNRVDLESVEVKNLIQDEPLEHIMLRQAISSLEAVQRERLIRYYFYGESYSEIAKAQNVSARAVSYSIRTAEKKINEYYCTFTEKE